ncbi:MAG: hypothetical protein HFE62_01985 [Firmicutes bacterium]|nr:hypothetical protein [Bacillota bacterium]
MSSSNGKNIIDKILADAKAEADKTIDLAQGEAGEVISAAEQRAEKEKAAIYELSKAAAEKAKAKEISSAEMQAKSMVLSQKQKCIEEVIEEAARKLSQLTDDEYKVIIKTMVKSAPSGEIILSKKDVELLESELKGMDRTISSETRDIDGGFVVKNGDVEYNYSFESIISVEKETIEQLAAKMLFG